MPCARCILELRTSLAETKKILDGASSTLTTFSSSARKLTQRSRCCFLTWTAHAERDAERFPPGSVVGAGPDILLRTAHLLDELGFADGRVPPVVQDEDVWFGDSLTDFVEEKFLLKTEAHSQCVIASSCLIDSSCLSLIALLGLLTVFMSVDSAFPTRTKTSASKQKLSIQLSNS